MEPILIGSNENSDWVISKPQVSGNHAKIYRGSGNSLMIEDLDSTNGTFVNGRRIKRAEVTRQAKIVIADIPIDLKDIEHQLKRKSNDFSDEFTILEPVWNNFKKDVQQLKKKRSYKMLKIRVIVSLIPIIILILVMDQIESFALRYALFGISPVIFMVFSFFQENNPKSTEEYETLQENFLKTYICPKCKSSLGATPWRVLQNQKRCPRCNAVWSK